MLWDIRHARTGTYIIKDHRRHPGTVCLLYQDRLVYGILSRRFCDTVCGDVERFLLDAFLFFIQRSTSLRVTIMWWNVKQVSSIK